MLHITNGDAAAGKIRASGVTGDVLPWREVLHEGPVPAGLDLAELTAVRAAFMVGRAWATGDELAAFFGERDRLLARVPAEDEVVLWFEHDLYDQLQLLQLLDWFAEHPARRLTLVNPAEYLGPASPARLAELFAGRAPVTAAQLEEGRLGWAAFRAARPLRMEQLGREALPGLPFVAPSFRRLLEQLPGSDDGLSRSERHVLESLMQEERPCGELFQLHNALEDPVWLGDATFYDYVATLAAGPDPLLTLSGDGPWPRRTAAITGLGREVLSGRADAVVLRGIDRWLGGVHLVGRGPLWRWDRVAGTVVER